MPSPTLKSSEAGDATAMLAATQQVSIAIAVALAGGILEAGMAIAGSDQASLANFSVAFLVAGCITVSAGLPFLALRREAGDEVAGRAAPAE